jgi:ABC-type phosphate transport system substrate-binding protein
MPKRSALFAAFLLAATAASAADLVVVGHPAGPSLTKDQVADLFLGKNLTMTPVDQPEGSPVHAEFYRKATGRDVAQVKATWARLVFSGKAQAPKQAADSAAVKRAVAADPKAVGYIEKSAVDGSVKVLLPLD